MVLGIKIECQEGSQEKQRGGSRCVGLTCGIKLWLLSTQVLHKCSESVLVPPPGLLSKYQSPPSVCCLIKPLHWLHIRSERWGRVKHQAWCWITPEQQHLEGLQSLNTCYLFNGSAPDAPRRNLCDGQLSKNCRSSWGIHSFRSLPSKLLKATPKRARTSTEILPMLWEPSLWTQASQFPLNEDASLLSLLLPPFQIRDQTLMYCYYSWYWWSWTALPQLSTEENNPRFCATLVERLLASDFSAIANFCTLQLMWT